MRKIEFSKMNWINKPGAKMKIHEESHTRVRIVEFTDEYIETDWCRNGHVGYILDGKLKLDFNGEIVRFKQGDAIYIKPGEEDKHKTIIEKGDVVKLLLFESLK